MRTGPVCCVAFCMSNAQTPHLLYEARCRPSRFLLRHVPGWSLSPLHAGRHGDPGRLGRLSGEAAPGRGPQCANPTPAQVQPLTRPSPWFQHSHPRARRLRPRDLRLCGRQTPGGWTRGGQRFWLGVRWARPSYALMEREPQGADEGGVSARPCRRLHVSWEK